jgi:phosphatidylglycerophosphatase A
MIKRHPLSRYYAWAKMLPHSWVRSAVTFGPLGYWGAAPGTIGSAIGFIFYLLIFSQTGFIPYALLLMLSLYLATALCEEGQIILNRADPGYIILDECVAIPICFWGIHGGKYLPLGVLWIIGFVMFRLFDIYKPLGINRLQKINGGPGVMLDDVAAAGLTWAVLHVLQLL